MRILIIILTLVSISSYHLLAQPSYYIASTGNDSNNGTSTSTPFRTIAKVNTLTLQAGSHVFFRRGDTFRGALTINQSGTAGNPIVIDAYGSGNKPIISGSSLISNWVSIGNGKWQANCPTCGTSVTGLYLNNISQPLGRYPNFNDTNRGYLTVQSHNGKTTLVSQQTLTTNWVGGEVVVRPNYFIIDRASITQQNGNALTLNNSSAYDLADQYGFFIQNHPATLDQSGEWYYDPSTKNITLYYLQGDPNAQSITASVRSIGIYSGGHSNIAIQNIRVAETLNYGFYILNCSNITISNCDIINSGENGVWFSGSGNTILVENNLISNTNNNAFQLDVYDGFTFRGNTIKNTALAPGRGKSGDAQYIGFIAYSQTNTLIENNTIDSTGHIALNFPKNNATVRRNIISNFCLTKSDAGGLYVTNNDQATMNNVLLQENIIFNGIGAPEGTPDGYTGAIGIYLDNCVQNVTVDKNTVFKSYAGIYLHGTRFINVTENTCFDNLFTQYYLDYVTACVSSDNNTQNNIFVSKLPTQYTAIYHSYSTGLSTFGTFNNNYYARPLDDTQTLRLSYPPPNGNLFDPQSLNQWQNQYGRDINSNKSPITIKDYTINSITGSERVVGGDFTTGTGAGIGGPFISSNFNNGQGTWDNNNRVNGGSLNLNFTSITNNPGASLYLAQVISTVSKDKDYIVQFDAISPAANRIVQVYMQTQFAPFREITIRPAVVVGPNVQHYEIALRPLYDEQNALLVVRIFENNQPLYIDNLSFREANITRFDPNDLVQLAYNPTATNRVVALNGVYRDVKNNIYSQQITLSPFSSVVLLRDIGPDLSPNIILPQSSFPLNASRDFVVNLFEAGGQSTSIGTLKMTVVVPTGYTLSFNNAISTINVTGADNNPVSVNNTIWTPISNVANRQISLKINTGQFIPANNKTTLGFTITRTSANSGSVSSITANVNDDPTRTYDGNSINNVYSRIITGL